MDDDGYEWKEVNGTHYWRIAGTSDSWTLWEDDSNYNQETSINDSVITGNVQHNKTVIQNDSDSIITAFLKGVNHNQKNEIVSSETIPVFTEAIEIGKLKGEDTSGNEAIRDNLKILEARRLKKNSEPEKNSYSPPSSQSVSPKISGDLAKIQDWNEHCDDVSKHFSMRIRSLATISFFASLILGGLIFLIVAIDPADEEPFWFVPAIVTTCILFGFGLLVTLTNNKRQYKSGFVDGKPVLFCSWCGEWVKNGTFSNGPEKMKNHWDNSGHTGEILRIAANLKDEI